LSGEDNSDTKGIIMLRLIPLLVCTLSLRADDPATTSIELQKGDRILFFGDSLTQLAGQEAPKEHVTKGYVRIVREKLQDAHKDKSLEIDWVATGGHKVTDMLKRVDKDVLPKKPTIVFIQIGVNDANAGVTPAMFKSQLEELIGKLQKGGAKVILCSLTSLGEKHDGTNRIDKKLDELAEVARTVAKEQKLPLNDLRKAFVEHWKKNNTDNKPSGLLTYDGNHFNQMGHEFVAEQMLKKLK
jgi:lysophospholipase L1-like esterase